MNKKFKYTSLVAAGAVTLGLVGGTLAWFTSQDSVTNKFSTGNYNESDKENTGIEIVENWKEDDAKGITPGSNVNKDVQVQNTVSYEQFIRVKLTPQFVKVDGENRTPYTEGELNELGITTDVIELNFTGHLTETLEVGTWVKLDGYYYYMDKVSGNSYTNTLLDSVTLSSEAGNQYHGLDFDVVVEAESIQASNGAYKEWAGTTLHEKYAKLEIGEADTGLVDDLKATDHNHN